MDQPIDLPVPPLCAAHRETAVLRGEHVVVELVGGRKLVGKLVKFDADKGHIAVSPDGGEKQKVLGMHEIRLMRVPQPRKWIRDEDAFLSQAKGMRVSSEPLEFDVEFSDHSSINGITFGFRNGRHGIHLFPVQDNDQYTHLFVPNNAIARHRIGKHLGQQLKDRSASDQDVAMILLEQQETRSRPLVEQPASVADNAAEGSGQARTAWEKKPQPQSSESLLRGASHAGEKPVMPFAAQQIAATAAHDSTHELLRALIHEAIREQATAIHFEECAERGVRVRLRKDGELVAHRSFSADQWLTLLGKLKGLSRVSGQGDEHAVFLDADFLHPLALEVQVCLIDTLSGGEDAVLKLSPCNYVPALGELGLSQTNLKRLDELGLSGTGLLLTCGPARSETSPLLHALLLHINTGSKKIWMVDDGLRKLPEPIRQVSSSQRTPSGIGALLSADPDVVAVDDITDASLAKRLVSAALAGPQILAGMPAGSSAAAVERLVNMGVPRHELADALSLALTQRTAKRLCPHCKKHYVPTADELRGLAYEYHAHLAADAAPKQLLALRDKTLAAWQDEWTDASGQIVLFRAAGCKHCRKTGYEGRMPLHELLEMTAPVRHSLLTDATAAALSRAATADGMKTLRQDGIDKALQGHLDLVQVRAACAR